MPRKKAAPQPKKNENPNVVGLKAEVISQPITETRLARDPGDRRLQAEPPEAAVHDV